jgi:hypothetical protein
VRSQLFTSWCNRYHQWLYDIKPIEMRAFFSLLSQYEPCFNAGKRIGGFELSLNRRTPENDHLQNYSLCGSTCPIVLILLSSFSWRPCAQK